ncbi:hypothetical protein KSF_064040 [Reticulibacter mediterranei]|uniref:Ribonucleotide reductase large subunit C-terminal domain-containing protein n=1 Tax=Reticulibacter mediterranei TaxID=2778369 RepID=A0A8J3IKU8_9CHLR|nr:hypothetical protein [Reticulibacter mediterranei]GHO96356.1 hypothetical protein KSF_064040 [Reticulibacter mediterranei]
MIERVTSTLFSVEEQMFGTPPADSKKYATALAECIVSGAAIPGTPLLTNAGRDENRSLSSCAMIPVIGSTLDEATETKLLSHYKQNMGAGFDFNDCNDPVALLTQINNLAARETATGNYDRYIGNMGLLPITHPSIHQFIKAKRDREMKHFNISINVSETFMERAANKDLFSLSNGKQVQADALLYAIAENAWSHGDPGLIFLDRMNRDNPLADREEYAYVTTPPCAELGLAKEETCHFGYINLGSFILRRRGDIHIDYNKMREITHLLTRALDNAIEYSLSRYPSPLSASISRTTRRIAIGVCGLADVFLAYKLPYASAEARTLARDLLSFITYAAKCASIDLARQRESCPAMKFPANKYVHGSFLEEKYAQKPTHTVSAHDWACLASDIRNSKNLRNLSVTALAPSGRSSLLLDATSSIEPLFSIFSHDGTIQPRIVNFLMDELNGNADTVAQVCQMATLSGSFQQCELLPASIRACLKTAKEIEPMAHLQMAAEIAGVEGVVDEAASKTVNLPYDTRVSDVVDIFLQAYRLGLKNISIYRDKTKAAQPEML